MATKLNTTKTATAAAAAKLSNTDVHTANAERVAHMQALFDDAGAVPSHTRQLIASIAQLFSFSASIYWGLQVTGWLMTAAIVFTNSAFLAFVIGVVAVVLSFRAAWKTGTFVADLILNFNGKDATNLGHELRIAAARKTNIVRSWFKRDDRIEVAGASA